MLGFSSQLFISLIFSFIYSLYTAVFNQPISLVHVPVQSYFDRWNDESRSIAMDPITILTTAGTLVATCVTIGKTVQYTVEYIQNAPRILTSIAMECNIFATHLKQFQVFLQRQEITRQAQNQQAITINRALCEIKQTLTELENEIGRATGGNRNTRNLGMRGKWKVFWNKDRLKDLLQELRGKQNSLSCLTTMMNK